MKKFLTFCLALLLGASAYFVVPSVHKAFLYSTVAPSVVMLENERGGGGTGFQVSWKDKLYVVSNAHVCNYGNDAYMYASQTGKLGKTKIKILQVEVKKDLCLLEALEGLRGLLVNGASLSEMSTVHIFGHPYLRPISYSTGIIQYRDSISIPSSRLNATECACYGGKMTDYFFYKRCELEFDSYASDAPIYPGNSGSPVLDHLGQVRAVVYAGGPGVGFFIPGETLVEFLDNYSEEPCNI